ncbi:hypothetical protein [Microcoleus sp. herbarium2]|uniref:hypothetical protein n=1 Tax=Microcoleus sp. herbarium2 TaxID=3055433 RepID=UPI002FD249C2
MNSDHETRAQLKTEMAGVNITVSLTGEEVLSLVALAQLAYLSNPALGELGECGKAAAQKIQEKLDPTSLLAQHLSKGWVSKDFGNFEPVLYQG